MSTQILEDIMVIAVEGGINYWADVELYTRDRVILVDQYNGEQYEVTPEVVSLGLQRLSQGEGYSKSKETPAWFRKYWRRMYADVLADDADFDVTDADVVLQAALFNEIVYG